MIQLMSLCNQNGNHCSFFLQIEYASVNFGTLIFLSFLILFLYASLKKWQNVSLEKLCSRRFFQELNLLYDLRLFWVRASFISISFAFAVIALMQPVETIGQKEMTIPEQAQAELIHAVAKRKPKIDALVCLLDVSASMLSQDASNAHSRIDRAKEILESYMGSLGGIPVALYAFSGDASEVVPPTFDYLYARISLQGLGINQPGVAGTDFKNLFSFLKKKYKEDEFERKVVYLLLSDGEDTTIMGMEAAEQERYTQAILDDVQILSSQNNKFVVVGLGSEAGSQVPHLLYEGKSVISKMQKKFLEKLAKTGNGIFYIESNYSLASLVDALLQTTVYSAVNQGEPILDGVEEGQKTVQQPLFQYPLSLSIFFLLLSMLAPISHNLFFFTIALVKKKNHEVEEV